MVSNSLDNDRTTQTVLDRSRGYPSDYQLTGSNRNHQELPNRGFHSLDNDRTTQTVLDRSRGYPSDNQLTGSNRNHQELPNRGFHSLDIDRATLTDIMVIRMQFSIWISPKHGYIFCIFFSGWTLLTSQTEITRSFQIVVSNSLDNDRTTQTVFDRSRGFPSDNQLTGSNRNH